MLRQYLDDEGAAAPGLRARLTSLAGTQRMPMEIWWALLQAVADVHPRVATGIEIGKHARPHHDGVLGYLAMSCDTLGQALARFQRFQPLLHNPPPTLAPRKDRQTVVTGKSGSVRGVLERPRIL